MKAKFWFWGWVIATTTMLFQVAADAILIHSGLHEPTVGGYLGDALATFLLGLYWPSIYEEYKCEK